MRIKKESLIVIFYILYFTWLFTVTYLTQDLIILNYFSISVAIFYFIFLRGEGDFFWFSLGFIIALILITTTFKGFQIKFDASIIRQTPVWLPIAWGTTFVALRKFYVLVSEK